MQDNYRTDDEYNHLYMTSNFLTTSDDESYISRSKIPWKIRHRGLYFTFKFLATFTAIALVAGGIFATGGALLPALVLPLALKFTGAAVSGIAALSFTVAAVLTPMFIAVKNFFYRRKINSLTPITFDNLGAEADEFDYGVEGLLYEEDTVPFIDYFSLTTTTHEVLNKTLANSETHSDKPQSRAASPASSTGESESEEEDYVMVDIDETKEAAGKNGQASNAARFWATPRQWAAGRSVTEVFKGNQGTATEPPVPPQIGQAC